VGVPFIIKGDKMKNSFQLFLEGYGYLEGIEQKEGKAFARIRVARLPSESDIPSDEVALYCVVETPFLLLVVRQLESRRLAGHRILLSFRATYTSVCDCFPGRTPEDPAIMLSLNGELLSIAGWFEDDDWVFPDSVASETVSSIQAA